MISAQVATLNKRVPSPEEIAAIVQARAMGIEPESLQLREQKLVDLEERTRQLEIQTRRSKRSAKELQEAMYLLMEKHDFSPMEELVQIAISLRGDPAQQDLRVKILQDLMQYTQPKLKSVEVRGEVDHKHTVVIVRYGEDGRVSQERLSAPGAPQVLDVAAEAVGSGGEVARE